MVLDQIVVQQMGKENEEGDIDDLLLRGAAALYEASEEGVAASDIRYTSKGVDELIDKVEADADAEAQATEEREKEKELAKARGEAERQANGGSEEQVKPKESMSFGFAKIWEADKNRLEELAEEEERPDDVNTWQLVIDNARKVREVEKAAMLENGRQKRAAAVVKYGPDGAISDDTPKKEKRRYIKKGKGRVGTSSEDADFVGGIDSSDSDSGNLAPDEEDQLASLLDSDGKPVIRGMAAGVKYTKKQLLRLARLRAKETAMAAATGDPNGESGVDATGSNGDLGQIVPLSSQHSSRSSKTRANETPEARLARKQRRKAAKDAERDHRYQKVMEAERARRLNGGDRGGPSVSGPSRSSPPRPPPAPLPTRDLRIIRNGQQICQYLYHVLREFRMTSALQAWAMMALPELPAEEREAIYLQLAQKVDMELYRQRQSHYFTHPQQMENVLPLLRHGYPVIPSTTDESTVPALQSEMGIYRQDPMVADSNGDTRAAYHSPITQPATVPGPTVPPAAAVPPPHLLPIENGHLPINVNPSAPTSHAATPVRRISRQKRPVPATTNGTSDEKLECPHCGNDHTLEKCRAMMGASDLEALRETVLQSTPDNNADPVSKAWCPG